MPEIIFSSQPDFEKALTVLLNRKAENNSSVNEIAQKIINDVIQRGDEAVIEYTNKFDRVNIVANQLKVSSDEIELAYKSCNPEVIAALNLAAKRIEQYHQKQMPSDFKYNDTDGVLLGNIWKSINSVGIYVPGGLASYPSSVLMNAVPAKVAGVKKIIMTVPAPDGKLNPLILAAAKIAGITEIYRIGGAQAVAALAYGTKTIPAVDKITGPGNAYVAAAKKIVFGRVGIDMVAGPSEILVVSDNKSDPSWIAADLLSQAEHDTAAQSILITDDEQFAKKVSDAIQQHLSTLERSAIAAKSWHDNGAIIIVENLLKDAVNIIDCIAPEHLELAIDNPEEMAVQISNAGAIFLGRYTPEAIGDYIAGPSHVLPTAGTARFSSGLSVFDFLKRVSLIGCNRKAFLKLAQPTDMLAEEEGLGAHALSIKLRLKDDK